MNWKTYFAYRERSRKLFWIVLGVSIVLHLLVFKPSFGETSKNYCLERYDLCVLQQNNSSGDTAAPPLNATLPEEPDLAPKERYWFSCDLQCEAAPADPPWQRWLHRVIHGPLFILFDLLLAAAISYTVFRVRVHREEKAALESEGEGDGETGEEAKEPEKKD